METTRIHPRYVEWLSAEDMHKTSQDWLSQLHFAKDEHHFFEDIIKSFVFQLIKPEKYSESKELIDEIKRSKKQNDMLIKEVIKHEKGLQIMVDGIDQPKEEDAYKEEHRRLIIVISEFLRDFRILKTRLFKTIKAIRKAEKRMPLLDKE